MVVLSTSIVVRYLVPLAGRFAEERQGNEPMDTK